MCKVNAYKLMRIRSPVEHVLYKINYSEKTNDKKKLPFFLDRISSKYFSARVFKLTEAQLQSFESISIAPISRKSSFNYG